MARECHQRHFEAFEQGLDSGTDSPEWLAKRIIAKIVADALHYYDQQLLDLIAYSVMPNHVHLIIGPGDSVRRNALPLYRILQSIKRFASRQANIALQRSGRFWQPESYDHVIRDDDELKRIINYVAYHQLRVV